MIHLMQKLEISSTLEATHSDLWLRKHTLHMGDKTYGILVMPKKTTQNIAVASTALNTYHFVKKGVINPEIAVLMDAEQNEVGTMRLGFDYSKGELDIIDLPNYTWRRPSIWKYLYEIRNEDQELICSFRSGNKGLKQSLEVEMTGAEMPEEELCLVLLMGWYLMLLLQASGRRKKHEKDE